MEIDLTTKKLLKIVKKPAVNIEFSDLCCIIGKKTILNSINGKFNSGHLTGILGSSGAGKTTLLNVLAGQVRTGISGKILINGEHMQIKKFLKISSYIMQEDLVQPYLTVKESITIATNLKVSRGFSIEQKTAMIFGILSVMGLEECMNTQVEYLSGGQRKRLIIALELVNNPSVIFLDEPTTGLDYVAMINCMHLLKSLTLQGRTIVCTLHQPSDSMFKLFDRVYFMSDGYCIYNGSVPELVPFLSSVNLICPINYNPADYIIEATHTAYANTLVLKDISGNGRKIYSENLVVNFPNLVNEDVEEEYFTSDEFSLPFWTQFSVLMKRNFLQIRRNKIALALHFVHNFICGVSVGFLFLKVGMKGSQILLNFKFLYSVVIYLLFTHMMSSILLYPFEVKLLEREYFNRWYSLKAYFAAFTVGLLPIIVVTTTMFVAIVYFITGQPLEWNRFGCFCLICILMVVASQGMGYTIGTLFNPTRGACVGSASAVPLVLLGIYGMGYGDSIETSMKFCMALSFPYHAFVGLAISVLTDRGNVECDELFCLSSDAGFWLEKMGMADKNYTYEVLYLVAFTILHRIMTYFFLRIRVSPDCTIFRALKLFDLS